MKRERIDQAIEIAGRSILIGLWSTSSPSVYEEVAPVRSPSSKSAEDAGVSSLEKRESREEERVDR